MTRPNAASQSFEDGNASTSSPYAFFAQALSQCQGAAAPALLDGTDGLALQFANICNDCADAAADDEAIGKGGQGSGTLLRRIHRDSDELAIGFLEGYEEDEEDAGAWRLEEQTWRLIHALHAERTQRLQQDLTQPSTSKLPYQTPFSAVQDIIDANAAIAELKIVRDWLSGNLACTYPVEVRKGFWPYTKNRLRGERRLSSAGRANSSTANTTGSRSFGASKGVKSLDPDAVTREASTLELEDATYEKALSRTLFEYVRGGQLDAAIDLARQSDRHWRAASLRGANLYWRPGLNDEMEDISTPMGNRNRALWKAVCRALCAMPSIEEYERALYGALSGDLRSVLTVSTTWEAHLWAHANARLEASIDAHLDKTASWWSQDARTAFGVNAKDLGAVQLTELSLPRDSKGETGVMSSLDDAPLAVELRDVFVKLSQTEQHAVNQQANHPFRIVQRALILSEVPALLTHVESLLPSMKVTVSSAQFARLVRFFAHVVLYLRLLRWDQMPTDTVCNSILKTYVDILEERGEDELVALYASSLEPESATESYAHYLKTMDINERFETKQAALLRAEAHDLDVAAVAVSAVTMIFEEILPSLVLAHSTPKTPLAEISTALTTGEERLVKALDWLCIHESTHIEAIVHANALMRLFLNNGRLNAARTLLFDQLPGDVIAKIGLLEAEGDPDLQALEFVHWRSFFEALAQHMRFVEVWSKRPADNASRIERHNWVKGLEAIVAQAQAAIEQVLQMDWLKLSLGLDASVEDPQIERRLVEVARIRQIYIPELVFRLHNMLFQTRDVLSDALASAIRLPTLVADERHKLYLDFVTDEENRLGAYLEMVRQAELASLERNPDPFYLTSEA